MAGNICCIFITMKVFVFVFTTLYYLCSSCFNYCCGNSKDTSFTLYFQKNPVVVSVRYPSAEARGNLLLLHGWNLPPQQWCEKTGFCKTALDSGFVLIIPSLGKTTYHYEQYPETISKYRIWPTRKWMYDTLLTHLQNNFSVLQSGQNNFVAGISTGGRGASLFALENPEIFNACAALSADFDQTKIPDEPINNGYYGSFKKFPKRWAGRDNIYNRAGEFRVPIFIAHGKKDAVCPFSQSESFYKKLVSTGKAEVEFFSDPDGGHDYFFWEKTSDKMIRFFIRHAK